MAAIKQKLITVIEVIYAHGFILLTFCINKTEFLCTNWTLDIENMAKGTKLAYSKKGCTNQELAVAWLRHVDTHTRRKVSTAEESKLNTVPARTKLLVSFNLNPGPRPG